MQITILDLKVWIPFLGAGFYEECKNWWHVPTTFWLISNINGRTLKKEHKRGSYDFGKETKDPCSFM